MEPADILMMNHNLFERMRDLAERQEILILEEKMDEFNVLLNQRDQLRKDITANTRRYNAAITDTNHKSKDQKVIKITSKIENIILLIQDIDKRIEGLIISKKEAFQDDIKNIRRARTAIRSYGGARPKTNKFMDRKG